jgi:hypothetical protein
MLENSNKESKRKGLLMNKARREILEKGPPLHNVAL